MNTTSNSQAKKQSLGKSIIIAILKLLPVFVLAALMIMGQDALVAAPVAAIVAVAMAMIVDRLTFKDCIDAAIDSVKNIIIALFILMFAYAMASAFMSTGVGASVVNLALSLGVTARSTAVLGLAVTAVLSVATGSSWGTFAACAPIFLWLIQIVDPNCVQSGSLLLVTCATAGGACFGDNIGLISDTTIVSSGIQGVEVVDRIRTQGVWSLMCLILAGIAFYVAGIVLNLETSAANTHGVLAAIPESAFEYLKEKRPAAIDLLNQVENGVAYYMIIPLILVIVLAVIGLNTFVCIGSGIVSAYILGLFAGTTSWTATIVEEGTTDLVNGGFQAYINMCKAGFADAGSWVVVMMMWVAAFGGVMGRMKAFDPLAKLVVFLSKKVRTLMFFNGLLSLLGNAILADEMAQIVTVGPIIKTISEENLETDSEEAMYKIKLRNATFGDAMGVFGSQLIPWHVYLAFYIGIASNVFPLFQFKAVHFIMYNFMAMIAVSTLLILTLTGLDRFIPLFALPSEPEIRLKRGRNKKEVAL